MWEPVMGKLTVLSAKNAKAGRHGDSRGLYLLVKETGARSWMLRVQVDGRRRDMDWDR
ncbi:Arm DNA-binding domain-containing protein [Parasphingorhabdus halotolerans]|uniref:Arm DNA-binding domain-containing protein n=1 Tax=Parasphingorhabdus halotolerans TaxID=2725558 RepID=UPI003CCD5D21